MKTLEKLESKKLQLLAKAFLKKNGKALDEVQKYVEEKINFSRASDSIIPRLKILITMIAAGETSIDNCFKYTENVPEEHVRLLFPNNDNKDVIKSILSIKPLFDQCLNVSEKIEMLLQEKIKSKDPEAKDIKKMQDIMKEIENFFDGKAVYPEISTESMDRFLGNFNMPPEISYEIAKHVKADVVMTRKYKPIILKENRAIRNLATIGLNLAIRSEAFEKKDFLKDGKLINHKPEITTLLPLVKMTKNGLEIYIPKDSQMNNDNNLGILMGKMNLDHKYIQQKTIKHSEFGKTYDTKITIPSKLVPHVLENVVGMDAEDTLLDLRKVYDDLEGAKEVFETFDKYKKKMHESPANKYSYRPIFLIDDKNKHIRAASSINVNLMLLVKGGYNRAFVERHLPKPEEHIDLPYVQLNDNGLEVYIPSNIESNNVFMGNLEKLLGVKSQRFIDTFGQAELKKLDATGEKKFSCKLTVPFETIPLLMHRHLKMGHNVESLCSIAYQYKRLNKNNYEKLIKMNNEYKQQKENKKNPQKKEKGSGSSWFKGWGFW